MQDLRLMSGTGVATSKIAAENWDILVDSIRLIPPLPYEPTIVSADRLRGAIIQVVRERQAKEREAALDGSAQ
jgi:hypothetical protein